MFILLGFGNIIVVDINCFFTKSISICAIINPLRFGSFHQKKEPKKKKKKKKWDISNLKLNRQCINYNYII